MSLTYSIAIRTLGTAGEKFRRELQSIAAQTVQPEKVVVYIAKGYPRPEFTVGREEYVWVAKGMHSQRALRYDEITSDCILMLDDDVLLAPDRAEKMLKAKTHGKTHFLIVVAEGVGQSDVIAREIQEMTGMESRVTVLGHVQRGGSPTVRDRVLATEMGYYAVELLAQDIGNRIIGLKDGKVYDIDLQEGLAMKKPFIQRRYEILNDTAF